MHSARKPSQASLPATAPVKPWLPACCLWSGVALCVALGFILPIKTEIHLDELCIETIYTAVVLYAYRFIARISASAMALGWALFCVSLMLDVADEVVVFSGLIGKTLEDIISFIGVIIFAYGCKQNADALTDALQQQRNVSQQLSELAFTDPLTRLPNRAELLKVMESWLARRQPFSVLMLDLNGFKPVNDQHGHNTGDALLQVVAERLGRQVRSMDFVARHGGDEFIILQADAGTNAQSTPFAKKVHASFDVPFVVGEQSFQLGVSIGIAHYPEHGEQALELFSHADSAMYFSKQHGSGPHHYHGGSAG